jgi:hypothetical protein
MSIPIGSVPMLQSSGVPKPCLPPGWSCHVSRSVPGRCYYFNKGTGDKTWELSELLPSGHTEARLSALHHPQSWQTKPPQQSAFPDISSSLVGKDVASMGVSELEALLAKQKSKLKEMVGRGPNLQEVPAPDQSSSRVDQFEDRCSVGLIESSGEEWTGGHVDVLGKKNTIDRMVATSGGSFCDDAMEKVVLQKDTIDEGECKGWSRKTIFDLKSYVQHEGANFSCTLCDSTF